MPDLGANAGLLKDSKSKTAARFGWVQQVGYAPVEADDIQLYGAEAFLLAASEVSRGRL